jgi:hypothetical protein
MAPTPSNPNGRRIPSARAAELAELEDLLAPSDQPTKRQRFLEGLIKYRGNFQGACAAAELSDVALFEMMRDDDTFAADVDAAIAHVAYLEALDSAFLGDRIPVVHKGEVTSFYVAKNRGMLKEILRARVQGFGDRVEHVQSGQVEHVHTAPLLSGAEYLAQIAAMQRDASAADETDRLIAEQLERLQIAPPKEKAVDVEFSPAPTPAAEPVAAEPESGKPDNPGNKALDSELAAIIGEIIL